MAGEHVTIIVNHFPSRFAGIFYREEGGRQIRQLKDSLLRDDPNVKILIMGDMNDDPSDRSMSVALGAKREIDDVQPGGLFNPFWNIHASKTGTLMYDGKWNLFDQIIVSYSLLNKNGSKDFTTLKYWKAQIFRRDYLFLQGGPDNGSPLRTHSRGIWLDGYSDHLPTVVYLVKESK
jgi:endonuclease/exonuclease/phosphatase family metal-dependent hydrolase